MSLFLLNFVYLFFLFIYLFVYLFIYLFIYLFVLAIFFSDDRNVIKMSNIAQIMILQQFQNSKNGRRTYARTVNCIILEKKNCIIIVKQKKIV